MFRCLVLLCSLAIGPMAWSQSQDPMAVLKKEAGTWDCELRFYPDSEGKPVVSKGVESNHMVGEHWIVSDFQGELAGSKFHGSSQMGYDPKGKKYIGSWIDSASPYPMSMEGTYDGAGKTLTVVGVGKDPNGGETRMKLVTVYTDNDHRTTTMFLGGPGDTWTRLMEFLYQRRK